MNKSNKIFLVLIIILVITLVFMTVLYLNMRDTAKENLNQVLKTAEENSKLNQKISELEEKINISTVTNTTNMTTPNNKVVPVEDYVSQNEIPDRKNYSIDNDKVKIKVDMEKITPTSIEVTIINDNENEISYGEKFKIQENKDGEWKDLEYLPNSCWITIAYITKGNSETTKKLNLENVYGELSEGTYRVAKSIYNGNGGEVEIYSDEFEIK